MKLVDGNAFIIIEWYVKQCSPKQTYEMFGISQDINPGDGGSNGLWPQCWF